MDKDLIRSMLSDMKKLTGRIIYMALYKADDERIIPSLSPTYADMDQVLSSIPDIKAFCEERWQIISGVLYIEYSIALSADAIEKGDKSGLSDRILLSLRRHWHSTRCIDISPLCYSLTAKQLILAFPVSRLGLRTLAELRTEQRKTVERQLSSIRSKEIRIAKAAKEFRKSKKN